jgi:hypothetical protein
MSFTGSGIHGLEVEVTAEDDLGYSDKKVVWKDALLGVERALRAPN